MQKNIIGRLGLTLSLNRMTPWAGGYCDFRPLNRVTIKRPCAVGDVFNKTRTLASKLYKSGLDAWSGFNQLAAKERAKRLLQLITSRGLWQCTVLPFGV